MLSGDVRESHHLYVRSGMANNQKISVGERVNILFLKKMSAFPRCFQCNVLGKKQTRVKDSSYAIIIKRPISPHPN